MNIAHTLPPSPQHGWLPQEIFGVKVLRKEIPRSGGKPYVRMAPNGVAVLHTTEGWSILGAWNTLKHHPRGPAAPHFITGEGYIIQCRPLGVQAAALRDTPAHPNKDAYVQVEMCGYTGGSKDTAKHAMDAWQLVASTLKPQAALMAYLHLHKIVALKRAYPFPDDCSDMRGVWAREKNTRRVLNVYGKPQHKGYFYHLEVPGNDHYDCGALDFAGLVRAAQDVLAGVEAGVVTAPAPAVPPRPAKPQRVLAPGERSAEVLVLQDQLLRLGVISAKQITGLYDEVTAAAVAGIQAGSLGRLKVDGKYGTKTDALVSEALSLKKG